MLKNRNFSCFHTNFPFFFKLSAAWIRIQILKNEGQQHTMELPRTHSEALRIKSKQRHQIYSLPSMIIAKIRYKTAKSSNQSDWATVGEPIWELTVLRSEGWSIKMDHFLITTILAHRPNFNGTFQSSPKSKQCTSSSFSWILQRHAGSYLLISPSKLPPPFKIASTAFSIASGDGRCFSRRCFSH